MAAFLGAGVDPAALNSEGRTPLYYARQNGHEGCAALLRGESPPIPRRFVEPQHVILFVLAPIFHARYM